MWRLFLTELVCRSTMLLLWGWPEQPKEWFKLGDAILMWCSYTSNLTKSAVSYAVAPRAAHSSCSHNAVANGSLVIEKSEAINSCIWYNSWDFIGLIHMLRLHYAAKTTLYSTVLIPSVIFLKVVYKPNGSRFTACLLWRTILGQQRTDRLSPFVVATELFNRSGPSLKAEKNWIALEKQKH